MKKLLTLLLTLVIAVCLINLNNSHTKAEDENAEYTFTWNGSTWSPKSPIGTYNAGDVIVIKNTTYNYIYFKANNGYECGIDSNAPFCYIVFGNGTSITMPTNDHYVITDTNSSAPISIDGEIKINNSNNGLRRGGNDANTLSTDIAEYDDINKTIKIKKSLVSNYLLFFIDRDIKFIINDDITLASRNTDDALIASTAQKTITIEGNGTNTLNIYSGQRGITTNNTITINDITVNLTSTVEDYTLTGNNLVLNENAKVNAKGVDGAILLHNANAPLSKARGNNGTGSLVTLTTANWKMVTPGTPTDGYCYYLNDTDKAKYVEFNYEEEPTPTPTPDPGKKDESCEKVIGPTWHWNNDKGICEEYATVGTSTR